MNSLCSRPGWVPYIITGLFLIALGITGCAAPQKPVEPPDLKPPVVRFDYYEKGKGLEAQGDLVSALTQYRLAATVDPQDPQVLEARLRVERALQESARSHYETALRLQKEGKLGPAHREFLIALRLWPEYPEVVTALTDRKEIKTHRFVLHTVKPGESLSKLAQIYYGDSRQVLVIAQFNSLPDVTSLRAGQQIKIPQMADLPFLVAKKEKAAIIEEVAGETFPEDRLEPGGMKEASPTPQGPVRQAPEPLDQATLYRNYGIELYAQKRYPEALDEFGKVLSARPADPVALEYSYKSSFENGMHLFEKKEYLTARDQFRLSLRYRSDCQRCHSYIKQCEESFKELHYKKGMEYYQQERLNEAIREWELLETIDPDYKRTSSLITKAKMILKKLDEMKMGTK